MHVMRPLALPPFWVSVACVLWQAAPAVTAVMHGIDGWHPAAQKSSAWQRCRAAPGCLPATSLPACCAAPLLPDASCLTEWTAAQMHHGVFWKVSRAIDPEFVGLSLPGAWVATAAAAAGWQQALLQHLPPPLRQRSPTFCKGNTACAVHSKCVSKQRISA